MARISCADCKFFSSVSPRATYEGECRKNAPTLVDELGMAVFPRVEDADWCGDFLRLPELYDVDDNYDDDEQDYDVDLPDYDDENTADVTQQDLFDDYDEPDDGRFDEGADYHNPYQDWENKDSAIDNLVQNVSKIIRKLDLIPSDIGDHAVDLSHRLVELEKQVQILKQPKERVGW